MESVGYQQFGSPETAEERVDLNRRPLGYERIDLLLSSSIYVTSGDAIINYIETCPDTKTCHKSC